MFKKSINIISFSVLVSVFFGVSGVHADGLPGEYLLSERWRMFFTSVSPLNNPANLSEYNYSSFRGVTTLASDDVARLWELGLVFPLGLYNTLGLSWICENGKGVSNGVYDSDTIVVDAEERKNINSLYMFSYSTQLWRGLVAGLNLNLMSQSNFGEGNDYNVGMDVGLYYRLFYHQFWGYHRIGLMYRNLPIPQVGEFNRIEYSPLVKASYHASFLQDLVEFDAQFNLKDFTADPQEFLSGKREYEWDLLLSGSYWVLKYMGLKGYVEIDQRRSVESFGFAGSFNLPHINRGKDLSFTYQYRDEVNSVLQGTHSVYLKSDFGKHREEIFARRVGRDASLSANDLYNKAMKLYYEGKYWDAYFIYARILTEYPDFYKNDLVMYHSGSCLENLDMREEAIAAYEGTKGQFPLSSIVPNADLGLMRIHYRQQDFNQVRNQYVELNRPTVNDSLRTHGSYLLGETYILTGEFRKAEHELSMVNEGHPDYILAQLSIAICHSVLNSGMHLVINSLENCINAEVNTPAQKEAFNRACMLLGYAFYEEGTLAKAVTALRMVKPESYYYEEALLGLAWTAIKARQWGDAIQAGQKLSASGYFSLQAEGALIESYGHMLEKRYPQAMNILSAALNKINAYIPLSPDSIRAQEDRYRSNRNAYSGLASDVVILALRGITADKNRVEALRSESQRLLGEMDNHYRFMDRQYRSGFFFRNLSNIKEDMEYALAKAQKLNGSNDLQKNHDKMINKERELDKEIEKLKRQMEKISDQDTSGGEYGN